MVKKKHSLYLRVKCSYGLLGVNDVNRKTKKQPELKVYLIEILDNGNLNRFL
jgi:hypothetical protein